MENFKKQYLNATDPHYSCWISANAGAGKTRILTRRVVRMLLDGIAPHTIVCITYTKAAAAEMHTRIMRILADWAAMDEEQLREVLEDLTGSAPSSVLLHTAQQLFSRTLDAPQGLHIQTIHAFCQSVLKRFPLEAGVPPYFTILENADLDSLQERAFAVLYQQDIPATLQEALQYLSQMAVEQTLTSNILKCTSVYAQMQTVYLAKEKVLTHLYQSVGIEEEMTVDALLQQYFTYTDAEKTLLAECAELLATSTNKSSGNTSQHLLRWLPATTNQREALLDEYVSIFLTKEYNPKHSKYIFDKKCLSDVHQQALLHEQERVITFQNAFNGLQIVTYSRYMLELMWFFMERFSADKAQYAALDYNDLIRKTVDLLQNSGEQGWVMYKLDGGIDHILLDEAQDTSPAQWEILTMLTSDFFAGANGKERTRSLFVVGDYKQSIYSFQGAKPEYFESMKAEFKKKVCSVGMPWLELPLEKSYRSTSTILSFVDRIYALDSVPIGLQHTIHHAIERTNAPGKVELWPLVTPDMCKTDQVSSPQDSLMVQDSYVTIPWPANVLAEKIADTITQWVNIPADSKTEPIEPEDILILVRRRTYFVNVMVDALKRRNIPVSGVDRLVLGDNLAVQDLISLAHFLLLPEDDLNLAALLKSPLCNLSEENIFTLAHARGDASMWSRLHVMKMSKPFDKAYHFLSTMLAKVDYLPPYEIFIYALEKLDGRSHIIGRMGEEYSEIIDEFMQTVLSYQQRHKATMQGFVAWFEHNSITVKRDLEQAHGEVRIMTVHAAKGLEARVVILPDTIGMIKNKDPILFTQKGVPVLSPRKQVDNTFIRKLREARAQREIEEHYRLLYVALTRAKDYLYIMGYQGIKTPDADSWYLRVEEVMEALGGPCETPFGIGKSYSNTRSQKPRDSVVTTPSAKETFLSLPAWAYTPAEEEVSPVISSDSTRIKSEAYDQLYQRGIIIHALFEHLPTISENDRISAATHIVRQLGISLSTETLTTYISEVVSVLTHKDYQIFFTHEALTEVPVSGTLLIEDKPMIIHRRIDRLVLTEESVYILDYKTHVSPPKDVHIIPDTYLTQMREYIALVQAIYPDKCVSAALLWTRGPHLSWVDTNDILTKTKRVLT